MNYDVIFSTNNPKLNDLVFCRYNDKLSTNLDQETVILDMTSGVYSQLNSVGTTIWDMLSQPASFTSILNKIVAIYEINKKDCINEIIDFLRDLAEHQLIQINNASDT